MKVSYRTKDGVESTAYATDQEKGDPPDTAYLASDKYTDEEFYITFNEAADRWEEVDVLEGGGPE